MDAIYNPRSRAWCGTLFTKDKSIETWQTILNTMTVDYAVWQEESTKTGNHHIQMYVYWASAKTLQRMKKIFPGAHLEVARGSAMSNKKYCQKAASAVPNGVRGERGAWWRCYIDLLEWNQEEWRQSNTRRFNLDQ